MGEGVAHPTDRPTDRAYMVSDYRPMALTHGSHQVHGGRTYSEQRTLRRCDGDQKLIEASEVRERFLSVAIRDLRQFPT